jgi:competence protein ComEC
MPFAWAGLGFSLGLFWGASHPTSSFVVMLFLGALGGGYLLARSASLQLGNVALLLAAALLGLLRFEDGLLTSPGLVAHHGDAVTISGVVTGTPEAIGTRVRFTLDADQADGHDVVARVVVWVGRDVAPMDGRGFPYLAHGDVVTAAGILGPPEAIGVFDYPEHLAARGIRDVLTRGRVVATEPGDNAGLLAIIHGWRRDLAAAVQRHVPEPEAAVVNALTLGLRGGITPEVNEAFRTSGLSHLLAVSGLHVGVLLAMVLGVSARVIGRHRVIYLVPPVLLLWTYVLLAGAPPSAVRAGFMGSVMLLALGTGRAAVPVNALGLTALLVLATDPGTLWDRAFQMSASAMAGVLLIGLPLAKRAFDRSATRGTSAKLATMFVATPLAVSLGAVFGSMPLVAFNFGQVPLLSVPATLIAMPLVAPLLLTGMLTGLVGLVVPPLASLLGLVPAVLGSLLVTLAEATAAIPRSVVETNVSVGWVWAAYVAMALAGALVYRKWWTATAISVAIAVWRGPQRRATTVAMVATFALLAAWPWATLAFAGGDGSLRLYFLDVGQGDATLIVGPAGRSVLIDGGRDPRQTINAIDSILRDGDVVIDVGILTHPDADHAAGVVELARRDRFGTLLRPAPVNNSGRSRVGEIVESGMPVTAAVTGTVIELGDGVRLEVLYPPDPPVLGTGADVNNNSAAILVSWNEASALFTGDLHAEGESVLLALGHDLDVDVLQVGHHGSATSSSVAFLESVTPSAAVISVGDDNPFGHPSPAVVERLRGYTAPGALFSTAEVGQVELFTDGERWFSRAEGATD